MSWAAPDTNADGDMQQLGTTCTCRYDNTRALDAACTCVISAMHALVAAS